MQAGYEVEWCVDLPKTPEGDADIDGAKYRRRDFATKPEAVDHARTVVKSDPFGSVRVTPFRMEPDPYIPRQMHREYVADAEYVDADQPNDRLHGREGSAAE